MVGDVLTHKTINIIYTVVKVDFIPCVRGINSWKYGVVNWLSLKSCIEWMHK